MNNLHLSESLNFSPCHQNSLKKEKKLFGFQVSLKRQIQSRSIGVECKNTQVGFHLGDDPGLKVPLKA